MPELDSPLLSPAEGRFRRAVRSQNRFINFLAILAVPAVLGIWLSVGDPDEIGAPAFWIVVVVLILVQIVLYFITTAYSETLPELHIELAELQERQDNLLEILEDSDLHIQWLEAANRMAGYWATFQALIPTIDPGNDEAFREACRIALSPMIDAGGVLFDFEFGEVWSVAVYRYVASTALLEPVWWKRTEGHPSEGVPRTWRAGDGHVGSAFMQDRILYTTDMASNEASMLLKPSASNSRSYDNEVYRSFVSAPILLDIQPEPRRFGVLVIASSEVGRFDEYNKSVVADAAQILASVFDWRRLAEERTVH